MKTRLFGHTDLEVSEIGLGTWQLGGDWGKVGERAAQDILSAAVYHGVRFFDTADVYGQGLSESRIGEFLKSCPERIAVATKLGRFPNPGWPDNFSLDVFRLHTEASLKRLGVEAIDITQIHCLPTEFLKREDLFAWLEILKQEGKIKHFGLSVESMEEALYCCDQKGVESLQIIFNIFRQKPLEQLFFKAREKGVALIIRLPLASGLLSGRFLEDHHFEKGDHRLYNRNGEAFNVGETFGGIPFEKGVELAQKLRDFVPPDMTMAQMALRWTLDYDAVTVVIPGATQMSQVVENAGVSELFPLHEELHDQLDAFYTEQVKPHIRGKY